MRRPELVATTRETPVLLADVDIAMIERALSTSGFTDDIDLFDSFGKLMSDLGIERMEAKDNSAYDDDDDDDERDGGEDC